MINPVADRKLHFDILCDNKSSYQIALVDDRYPRSVKYGKPAILVRCDRTDTEDNERGLKLAQKVANFLNTLTPEEVYELVDNEYIPPVF